MSSSYTGYKICVFLPYLGFWVSTLQQLIINRKYGGFNPFIPGVFKTNQYNSQTGVAAVGSGNFWFDCAHHSNYPWGRQHTMNCTPLNNYMARPDRFTKLATHRKQTNRSGVYRVASTTKNTSTRNLNKKPLPKKELVNPPLLNHSPFTFKI